MNGIHYSTVERAHAYTASKVPWQLEFDFGDEGKDGSRRSANGWRLFRYLSGGGMRTFGRSVAEEERLRRRRRFLLLAAASAGLWIIGFFC